MKFRVIWALNTIEDSFLRFFLVVFLFGGRAHTSWREYSLNYTPATKKEEQRFFHRNLRKTRAIHNFYIYLNLHYIPHSLLIRRDDQHDLQIQYCLFWKLHDLRITFNLLYTNFEAHTFAWNFFFYFFSIRFSLSIFFWFFYVENSLPISTFSRAEGT